MEIETWDEEILGTCDCCGNTTKYLSGQIVEGDLSYGLYYVFWTEGKLSHYPNFDFILGPCGEGSSPEDRIQVSLICLTDLETREFSVINAVNRNDPLPYKVAKCLNRNEVIGTQLAGHVFNIVDTIWLNDNRLEFMH